MKSLLERIYECVGPEIRADHSQKTYEIVREDIFFNNLARAYFTLRSYSRIESPE